MFVILKILLSCETLHLQRKKKSWYWYEKKNDW